MVRRRAATLGLGTLLLALGGASVFLHHLNQGDAPPPAWRPGFAKRLSLPGLANAAEVAPGLYRGAQPTPEGLEQLRKLGVKTVVSLRSLTSEEKAVRAAGLDAVSIPIVADVRGSTPPSRAQIEQFLALARDPARRPVYFHCAFGKDRTGTMCAVYRMEVEGWRPDEAFEEMRHFGFNEIWADLRAFVKGYKAGAR